MNAVETRRFEMLTRVRDFGAAHAADFPPATLGGEQFALVRAVVEELTRHAAAQASGAGSARQGSASRAVARAALRDELQVITRTARAMALDMPGLETKFRLPRSGSDQSLLATARAFASDALPLKAEFIRHELPADFLESLNTEIEGFENAVNGQNTGKDTRVAATASIDTALERGMSAAQRLDALVRNKFRNDPAVLAAWVSASHTERTAARTRADKPSSTDTNPPANAST
jgi:hypothetical protein